MLLALLDGSKQRKGEGAERRSCGMGWCQGVGKRHKVGHKRAPRPRTASAHIV